MVIPDIQVMNVINPPRWPVQWEGPDTPPLVFPRRDLVHVVSLASAVRYFLRKDSLFMQILSYEEIKLEPDNVCCMPI